MDISPGAATPHNASKVPDFFISRAGPDKVLAVWVGAVLEQAGYRVVIQDRDFANTNFLDQMDAALGSGARVIALLTPDYLATDYCTAEWMHPLYGDPLNRQGRLIVLRVAECKPKGLLRGIASWNLYKLRDDPGAFDEMVRIAVLPHQNRHLAPAWNDDYFSAPRAVIHPTEIRHTPSFTGRTDELKKIAAALASGDTAALTQSAAVQGLGGVGKSTLAREFAWQHRDDYAGVWWFNAEKAQGVESWPGVESGFIDLGATFIRGLDQMQDRTAAAKQGLSLIAEAGFEKPWLLVFDNVDDAKVLKTWVPKTGARVLVTSRLGAWGSGVKPVDVGSWPREDAVAYLLKETSEYRSDLTAAKATDIAEALGCLPLALSHAAAYLRENTNATAKSYLAAITAHMQNAPEGADYPTAVFATFKAQIANAEQKAPGATAILSLSAFFAPDDIPEELFQQDPSLYPPDLGAVIADPLALERAIGTLDRLSLIDFNATNRTFSVHRLVQMAVRDQIASPEWATSSLNILAVVWPTSEFADWPKIDRIVAHALTILRTTPDRTDVALTRLLNEAAYYLAQRAEYDQAEALYRRCLILSERIFGPNDPRVGTVSNNLAGIYRDQGRFELAEPLYDRDIDIIEQSSGPNAPALAMTLSNQAHIYVNTNRVELAEKFLIRSYEIMESTFRPDHPNVGKAANNLAAFYVGQNEFDKAAPLYEQDLQVCVKEHGWLHPDTGISLSNIGDLLAKVGQFDDALPFAERSHAVLEATLGAKHPRTQRTAAILTFIRAAIAARDGTGPA